MKANNKLIRITTVPLSFEKLLENQLHFMSNYYNVTAVSSNEARLLKVGKKEGVNIFAVELTRKITPFADLKALFYLYRFLNREKPLIVHSHTPKAGTIGMLAARLAGIKYRLHTVAGLPLMETSGNKRRLLNFVEKITYACATHVYPNSFGLKDIIEGEHLCSSAKLKVLANGSSNGIDSSYFDSKLFSEQEKQDLRNSLDIAVSDFVFIFVGRIVGDKGLNEMINAFIAVNEQYPNTKLLLVGDQEYDLDPLFPETLTLMENNTNILSVGYKSDVRLYFSISEALVFPSYREGFPNVVMQAGAMGLASIVSDINGCNEIIVNNKNGIIVPVKNTSRLLISMLKLVEDNKFLQELKSNSREMIVNLYEQKVVWEAILAEYKSLNTNV